MATIKKKPVAKKPAVKATASATHRTLKKPIKKHTAQSFKHSSEAMPFMTFRPTQQTAYWLILSVLVLALGAWVMYLNVKVQEIYDQIDMNTTSLDTSVHKPVKKVTHP